MKRYITVCLLLIIGINVSGQRNYELFQPETSSKTYVARDYIRLKPGFSFNSSGNKTFRAYINEHLLEAAAYQTTAQLPDPSRSLNQNYAVGTTAGEANVSPSGAAVYQIPVTVAPGTAGVQPAISVTYNSQSNNGLVGYGWSLNVVSAITRVGKTIYHDGSVAVPQLTSSDNLMFDGQRLMRASGTNLAVSSTYKTEIESYLEITRKNFGSYAGFEIKNKEGWILEYGSTADSYIKPKGGSEAYAWLLKKVTDANGNYMTYTYDNITASGEFRLKQIEYTGNTAAGLNPYNKVEFFYETRIDSTKTYIAGKSVAQSVILKRIKCSASGIILRDYRFNYFYDGFYSKLTEVEEYGQNGIRYNSTLVDWGDYYGEHAKYGDEDLIPFSENTTSFSLFADFNGDGRCDFITRDNKKVKLFLNRDFYGAYFYKKCEFDIYGDNCKGVVIADLNGDNLMDLIGITHAANNTYRYNYYFFDGDNFTNGGATGYYGFNTTVLDDDYIIGDFNGDGKQEILIRSTQKVYNQYGSEIASGGITWGSDYVDCFPNNRYLCDVNGDGKTDILVMDASVSRVYELSGNTFSHLASFNTSELTNQQFPYLGDFNGDGKTDVLVQNNNMTVNYMLVSTGTTFSKQIISNPWTSTKIEIGDANRDGKSDIFFLNTASVYSTQPIVINTGIFNGTSFDITSYTSSFLDYTYFNTSTPSDYLVEVADFDGDGRSEYCFSKHRDTHILRSFNDRQNLFVKTITNGLNQTTSFLYNPITDAGYCAVSSSSPSFPVSNFRQPLYVVTTMSNQAGNIYNSESYYYKGAKLHKQGKGFLGFEEIRVTNSYQNRKTTTQYGYNSTYYNVYPVKQTVTTTSGDSISRTDFQNNYFTTSVSKVIFPYVEVQTTTDKLTELVRKTKYAYASADHGNPNKITETQGSLITETENTWEAKNSSFKNRITQQKITKKGLGNTFTETKTFEYDAKAQLSKRIDFSGHAKAVTTAYTNYDSFGNPTTVTTTAANCPAVSTASIFDATGRFEISHTDALEKTSSAHYDALSGVLLEKTDIAGLKISRQYDGFQRLACEITPTDVITYSQKWDISGNNRYKVEANSQITGLQVTWYNAAGLETKSQSQGFSGTVIAEKEYNYKGQLYRSYLPGYGNKSTQYIEYGYDKYGRIQSETNIGRITSYIYSGLTTTVTTPDGKTRSSTLNTSGLLATSTDAAGDSVTYTYNSLGKPATTTANGLVSYINYDDRGFQRVLKDSNLADSVKYVYNAYGQLASQTNARGQTTSFQYDAAGRITQKTAPENTLTYEYVPSGNGTGQLQLVKQGTQTLQFYTYTALGQPRTVTETVDNENYTTTYSYNSQGQVQEKQSPSGLRVSYHYSSGVLTSMKNVETDAYLWQANAVNALGQITESTLGNGLKRILGYDTYHLPNQFLLKNGSSVVDRVDYAFSPVTGNLTQRNDVTNGRNEVFGYDALNRLDTVRLNSGAVNRITYAANGNIQTKFDVGTYQYANGNHAVSSITNKVSTYNPAAIDVTYTSYNRPSAITLPGATIMKVEFQYGPDNQRRRSRYSGNNLVHQTKYHIGNYEKTVVSGGSFMEYDYICTPEGLSAIAVTADGTRSFFYVQTDHLGSIRVVTTASKAIQTRYYYDAWGKQTLVSGTVITNRGYLAQEHLNDFGLINLNARLYDPVLARFMGVDPYVQAPDFTQAYNRYAYGLNNPLIYADPEGEAWWVVPVILASIFAVGNTVAHAVREDINNVGDFFKYFGQGAIVGFAIGCVWQFAPLITWQGVGQGIQTAMTWYAYGQAGLGILGTVTGAFNDGWKGVGNGAKAFLGNFYMDENNWLGGIWQGISRHTWEMPQSLVGHGYTQVRNTFGNVDRVDYFGGATFATKENSTDGPAVSLGNYINTNIDHEITGNFDDYVLSNPMYMHEYGHTIDSRAFGISYLFAIGIPSIFSADGSTRVTGKPYSTHDIYWTELRANRRAEKYFKKYYGISWTFPDYPLNK
jgi:RHS repeat-associated protein